jgi:hypothetical protein
VGDVVLFFLLYQTPRLTLPWPVSLHISPFAPSPPRPPSHHLTQAHFPYHKAPRKRRCSCSLPAFRSTSAAPREVEQVVDLAQHRRRE